MNQKLPLFRKFIRATLTLFLLQFFPFFSAHSQVAPKREVRGVWIATVLNIDYPGAPSTDEFTLKQQWTELLNKHKALGINVLHNEMSLISDETNIWFEENNVIFQDSEIGISKRIGVESAGVSADLEWRFFVKNNVYVSQKNYFKDKKW